MQLKNFRTMHAYRLINSNEGNGNIVMIENHLTEVCNAFLSMLLLKPVSLTLDKDPDFANTLKLAVQCSLKFSKCTCSPPPINSNKRKGKHSCN